jgi:class 3 adenylate cyclase
VSKANVSRQSLVEAIATLEAQRGPVVERQFERAIDTALVALRDKLAQVQAKPDERSRHQLSVLVADLSGYTALSEHMDAESLRDAINAMWRELDAVVRAWGGQIDQHAGDSLTALFGLRYSRRGDAGRALHAALAMQQELLLFNERARHSADSSSWAGEWPGPGMRIGVHSGPVYFARSPGNSGAVDDERPVGGSRPTAVGDAVAVARRLERLSPAGEVLASAIVSKLCQHQFRLVPLPAVSRSGEEPVFLVKGQRPVSTAYRAGMVAGQVTRWVARAEPMDRLELALQATIDGRTPHLAMLVGPPGAGKSRLIHEFEQQIRLLAGSPVVLRAGTQGVRPDLPYALVRDLLLRRFDIRPQDSRYRIEHRLRQGLAQLADASGHSGGWSSADGFAREVRLLEQMLDARTAADIPVEEALAVLRPLLSSGAAGQPVIVVLEGINRADGQSVALVDLLVRDAEAGPVLFLVVATTPAAAGAPPALPWSDDDTDLFSPIERIDVAPLSSVESRLMASQILGRLSPPSLRLIDLVVSEAGGNPFYIESFINLLIERGVLRVGEPWRVDMAEAESTAPPADRLQLTKALLAQLPPMEQTALRMAAVLGPLVWDLALMDMIGTTELGEIDVEGALLSLESKGYLLRDETYSFGATQAFAFTRDTVREAAYGGIPTVERRRLHGEAAHWLIANQNQGRFSAWFPVDTMIADHLEAAGDVTRAGGWRARAKSDVGRGRA